MSAESEAGRGPRGAALALAALGIVFGDIGTSPLYAVRECFLPGHGVEPAEANVLGVLSLVVWSLTLVVSVKYLVFIMRADNKGEGGTLSLLALIETSVGKRTQFLMFLGIAGAALFYESLPLLGYAGLFFLATHLFVLWYEEPTLRRTFGHEYEAYRRRVRRWWPSIRTAHHS